MSSGWGQGGALDDAAWLGASALALGLDPQAPMAAWSEALGHALEGPEALPGALVAHWSQGRGRRAAGALPCWRPPGPIPPLVAGQAVELGVPQEAPRWLWLLAYAFSWHTDDAGGGIVWVACEAQGDPVLLPPPAWAWPPAPRPRQVGPSLLAQGQAALEAWAELEPLAEGPELPPMARLGAESLARAWAEAQWGAPAREAERRYQASAARVHAAAQAQGVAPGPRAEAMAARLVAERSHRLGELARRHALRAQLQAIATLVVRRPGWQLTHRLVDGQGQAVAWTGWWDGLSGGWEGLACAQCGGQEEALGFASGQVLCQACAVPCAGCALQGAWRLRCAGCGLPLCPGCALQVPGCGAHCPGCAPPCPACGVASPPAHHRCPFASGVRGGGLAGGAGPGQG